MTHYCLICGKEWGPGISTCCVEGSLVATKMEGLFKKKRSYLTLDGKPLTSEQVDEMKRIVTAQFNERKSDQRSVTGKPASQSALRQAPSVAAPEQSASILHAAKRGDLEKIRALLEANPNLVFSKDIKEGLTPLHWASYMGHKDVVELLLGNKADVNAAGSKGGQTPLLLAAAEGHKGVTELLLAKGASMRVSQT